MELPSTGSENARSQRKALGRRLRALRLDAGLTGTDLAARAGIERTRLSRIENGRVGMTVSEVHAVAAALDLGASVSRTLAMEVRSLNGEVVLPVEHAAQASQAKLLELEIATTQIQVASMSWIPAIVQTVDYASAVLQAVATFFSLSASDLSYDPDFELLLRRRRQAELLDPTKRVEIYIHESAIWRRPSASVDMGLQMGELSRWIQRPNVTVRVVRDQAMPVMDVTSFAVYGHRSVTFDTSVGWVLSGIPHEVSRYLNLIELLHELAMSEEDSFKFLIDAESRWKELTSDPDGGWFEWTIRPD